VRPLARLLLVLVASAAGTALGGTWVKSPGGPVLGNAELGTCFDVNVVTDGPAPYTMYFSWRPQKCIALVRSDDAETWTQTPEVCLKADPTSGWEDDLNRSCTVKKDGVWHMWYTGQAKVKGVWGSRIGYATSTNGVRFTRVRKTPVLVPERDFEKDSVMNPYVRWDAKRKVWRMWYAAGETYEPNVLCYAESEDGLKWKKWGRNPIFGHGDRFAWDCDRVGACEVHPQADGRWVMFYIGYSDIDTARIGAAVSEDGISDWKRFNQNPLVSPTLGDWDSCACYKPSVLWDPWGCRWMLWYNGRSGNREYIGLATHAGADLGAASETLPDAQALLKAYVAGFNANDAELYTNAIPNAAAEKFLAENVPLFTCPDPEIERTYYFRWWTFRKHLRHDLGVWTVSEFLPNVGWAGAGNAIVCPAGHHFREGRWLRDTRYLEDLSRFWLADKRVEPVRRRYCSWLLTGVTQFVDVSGRDSLAAELLDAAVENFGKWEVGDERNGWPQEGKVHMGGDGKGGFLSIDNYEGSELSLGGHGYRPLMGAAMLCEAKTIAAVAAKAGRPDLAETFARKAARAEASLLKHSWNPALGFFTTGGADGSLGTVRELNGYAPWYFGLATGKNADWAQLADAQGFLGRYGLSFPERRAAGFKVAYEGHECQWNGPSWPYATSIALTALANDLHGLCAGEGACTTNSFCGRPRPQQDLFNYLLRQYAAQHRLTRADGSIVPWIDENHHPDTTDWISRTLLIRRKQAPRERGKDYNHSTFCDLVISGLVGLVPQGDGRFAVDPLAPATWDYFTLERLKYRGHEVRVTWHRGRGGLTVTVDGKVVARRETLGRVEVSF